MSFLSSDNKYIDNQIEFALNDEPIKDIPQSAFVSTLKGYTQLSNSDCVETIDKNVNTSSVSFSEPFYMVNRSIIKFIIIFIIGFFIFGYSFKFMPLNFKEYSIKFILLITLSNILIVYSFIFLYGAEDYYTNILDKKKGMMLFIFIISIISSFIFIMQPAMYLLSLIGVCIQTLIMLINIIYNVINYIKIIKNYNK